VGGVELTVSEAAVVLPLGILLTKGMREQFAYTGVLSAELGDREGETERLWGENKRLRAEKEALAAAVAKARGGGGVGGGAGGGALGSGDGGEVVAALRRARDQAQREAERLRAEHNAVATDAANARKLASVLESQLAARRAEEAAAAAKKLRGVGIFASSKAKKAAAAANAAAAAAAALGPSPCPPPSPPLPPVASASPRAGQFGDLGGGPGAGTGLSGSPQSEAAFDRALADAIDALNGRESEAAVLGALKRLINLSLNSAAHAVQFNDQRGVAALAVILKEYAGSEAITEKGLKLLVNLSWASEEAGAAMVAEGAVERVLACLDAFPTSPGVQEKGLWVLKNLAHGDAGARAVLVAGGASRAASAVAGHAAAAKVVDQGLGVLQNLAHHHGAGSVQAAWEGSKLTFAKLRLGHYQRPATLAVLDDLERDLYPYGGSR